MRHLARVNGCALTLAALLLSAHYALSIDVLGDYPGDGGPAMSALLRGDMHAFARAQPAMGALSLLVRAPFAAIAYLGHPSQLQVYRWGCLPCTLFVAALALWLAHIARRHGGGWTTSWAIVLLALVNPLLRSALISGHPEELMTASLCVGALIAACEQRVLFSAILLGLALACKQWALVAVLPILFTLERRRLRVLAGACLLALAVTVPEAVGAPLSFLHNQLTLARNRRPAPSILSWWWPLAPDRTMHVLVEGGYRSFAERRLPRSFVSSLHSLIIAVDALLALLVARLRGLALRRRDALALMAIVLLLRCTLDTETMPYYHEALFLDLLAWDALTGARLPLRSLSAWALSYLVFEDLSINNLGASYSLLYAAVTILALAFFTSAILVRSRGGAPVRAASLPARA